MRKLLQALKYALKESWKVSIFLVKAAVLFLPGLIFGVWLMEVTYMVFGVIFIGFYTLMLLSMVEFYIKSKYNETEEE